MRLALKVFLYNTGGVNYGSTMSLYPKDSFLHRMSALSYKGLLAAINFGDKDFKYQTHPEYIAAKNLGKEMEDILPMCTDGLKVWNTYRKFFSSYLDLFFKDDKAVTDDEELVSYWDSIQKKGRHGSPFEYGLPALSKASLADQMTHHAFYATCWHEFCGAIVHYLTTPEGLATKIYPGKEVMDAQTFIQGLCLIALTGTKQPRIMGDWKHLLPDEAHPLHTQLLADLKALSEEIEATNATAKLENPKRRRAVSSFNPIHFECSVSV